MFDLSFWLVLVSAAIMLSISPGPDLLYILSRTISQGRRIGFASSLGVCTGALVHVIASALGLSVILATSATAFEVVKYLGAAYLCYLGYKALREPGASFKPSAAGGKPISFFAAFRQGVMIDLLNPKVAIFFMAFLPQFIRPDAGPIAYQIIWLGVIVILVGMVVEFSFVLLAERVTRFLRSNQRASTWLDRMLGTVLIGLGIRLTMIEQG